MPSSSLQKIKSLATELGFDHIEATLPEISQKHQLAYQSWCDEGLAADMAYMTNAPAKRLDVRGSYPGAQSALTLGVSYYQGPVPEKPGKNYGRVARYAWGLDYHEIIPKKLEAFLQSLPEILGRDVKATLAVDTKPLLERALASQSGLGFIGKNTVLIVPRSKEGQRLGFHVGSFVFLAEILLDVELVEKGLPSEASAKEGCGGCTKCLVACPTDAFEGPYRLKSDRCIAYLTIENKGWIPTEMRSKIGDWLFGCDVCQDVCPFNARAFETRWPEFKSEYGAGAWVSLKEILTIPTQAAFKAKWGPTPLSRSKRKGLIRNACVVAGNSGEESLIPDLENLLSDEEALIRGHAVWALGRLRPNQKTASMAESQMKKETDPQVQNECEMILQQ